MSMRSPMRRRSGGYGIHLLAVAVVAALCVGGVALNVAASTMNKHWITCTVTDKDRGYDAKSGSSNYRIYTSDCDTLADTDSWLNGKHNSSNLFGQVQAGHRYRFQVVGFRVGIGSHFANILQVQEVAR